MVWAERRSGWNPREGDARTPWDVDYGRVIHSASFRRLQGKTQILNLGDSDFYRTRLTHSLEVAQIASGILRQFRALPKAHPIHPHLPDHALVQTIGSSHDMGHPPFGHGGEVALNYCMRNAGGFEGNGQTLRILSRLEKFSDDSKGTDVTRRALLGVLKYPASYKAAFNPKLAPVLDSRPSAIQIIDRKRSKPPKCYFDSEQEAVDWILAPLSPKDRALFQSVQPVEGKHAKPLYKSFDCSIMDVADDIAYGIHDMEDAIALGLITRQDFLHPKDGVSEAACAPYLDYLKKTYAKESANDVYGGFVKQLFGSGAERKHCINRLVGYFIMAAEVKTQRLFEEPLLDFQATLPAPIKAFLEALKRFVADKVILSPNVQQLEFKGQKMVVSVFEALQSEPKSFLPADAFALYEADGNDPRRICDYIAGMTDNFLLKTYERLFSPRMGSVFDRL
ncbi:anti-phage deoxyguanosine triphosphatase [Lacibacterium aquatile]|uniref:Anti-phage deoxyguanosine triphosphatase n=1 Tax=Lacibacterium aquatile TaxID=1168082 RepID=A0ABW5DSB8_9PROT